MNNLLKVITIVGAGILIGSVAGKFIKTDKIRLSGSINETEKGIREVDKHVTGVADTQIDELENYFI